jgi:hypothetical protein
MTHYEFVTDKTIGGTLTPLVLNQDDAVVNLSSATEILFRFEKPDGTRIDKVGAVLTSGVDGKALYTFVDGDLDQPGVWYYWLKITSPTWTLASDRKSFKVREDD